MLPNHGYTPNVMIPPLLLKVWVFRKRKWEYGKIIFLNRFLHAF
jgi:hypothetical protein